MANKLDTNNLPESFRTEVARVESAHNLKPLSTFVSVSELGKKSGMIVSNAFTTYDITSRFVRDKKRPAPLAETTKAVIKKEVKESQGGKNYIGTMEITPAIIVRGDDDFIAYPSDREEKVERALIRLASKGHIISISGNMGTRYAVAFSLNELQAEMKTVNQSINQQELKEALNVLKGTTMKMRLTVEEQESGESKSYEYTENYLDAMHFSGEVGRTKVKCVAVLNSVMESKIENMEYKGYLFEKTQRFSRSLTRWLSARLYTTFRFASHQTNYHFLLIDMSIKFGSIESKKITNGRLVSIRRDMTKTMSELKDAEIIADYLIENRKGDNGEIIDYLYTVVPSETFINEVIELNKQAKTTRIKMVSEEEIPKLIGQDVSELSKTWGEL